MPAHRAQRKVPGGKLVRVDVVCEQKVISKIRITGDFFVYPEEALASIERDLEAIGLSGTEAELEELVESTVSASNARLIGFSTKDLAEMLRELKC